jgi:hypothetical protein
MRNAATTSLAYLGRSFDGLLDAGLVQGQRDDGSDLALVGGGLGLRWRGSEALDVRARVGARMALGSASGEVLDADVQGTYRLPAGLAATLRLAHVEDNRDVEPEAAGDILHLALALPLGRHVALDLSAGGWLVHGAHTYMQTLRVEATPVPPLLLALDLRVLGQTGVQEIVGLVEADYRVGSWLRLGVLYTYLAVTGGIEHASRFQLRTQVNF